MTYAMTLNNVGFAELTHDEMLCVDGGGLWGAFEILCGVGATACIIAVGISTPAVLATPLFWTEVTCSIGLIVKGEQDW